MAKKKEQVSKQVIIEAARNVFIEKGFDGARMQEIADRADINKALLHYYFSSKENLFEEVFNEAFSSFIPRFNEELKQATTFKSFLVVILNLYIKLLSKHPYIPIFILSELHRNPDRPVKLVRGMIDMEVIKNLIEKEVDDGKLIKMDPRELITNILSLCIFPFAARPMIQRILWDNNEKQYQEFLNQRAETIYQFIQNILFIDNK